MSRAIRPWSAVVAADIDQVQPAAGTQDPEDLFRRSGFRVVVDMVQHHRRQHPVEFAVGVGQPLGVAALETDVVRLPPRPVKRPRVGVASDRLQVGMAAFGPDDEIPGAAADLQDTMAVGELGLSDERLVDPFDAQQA